MSKMVEKTYMIVRTDSYGSHYVDIPVNVNYGTAIDLLKYNAGLESARDIPEAVVDDSITVTDKHGKKITFAIEEHLVLKKEPKKIVPYGDNPNDLDYAYWH